MQYTQRRLQRSVTRDAQVVDAAAEARQSPSRRLLRGCEERALDEVGQPARVVEPEDGHVADVVARVVGDEREQLARASQMSSSERARRETSMRTLPGALEALGEQDVDVAGGLGELLERALAVHLADDARTASARRSS